MQVQPRLVPQASILTIVGLGASFAATYRFSRRWSGFMGLRLWRGRRDPRLGNQSAVPLRPVGRRGRYLPAGPARQLEQQPEQRARLCAQDTRQVSDHYAARNPQPRLFRRSRSGLSAPAPATCRSGRASTPRERARSTPPASLAVAHVQLEGGAQMTATGGLDTCSAITIQCSETITQV